MTGQRDLDRQLTAWLGAERPVRAPDGLFEAMASRVTTTRRRPGWVVADRWTWRGPRGLGARSVHVQRLALLVVVVLLMAALAGVQVIAGRPLPPVRIPADRGTFQPVAPMAFVREASTATTLRDGRVLVTGGYPDEPVDYAPEGGVYAAGAATAEIWDPATGSFTRTGDMAYGRWGHAAVLLRDGRVLVIGGYSPDPVIEAPDGSSSQNNDATRSAEIWDPATGLFTPAGDLPAPIASPSAWLEPDGRVRALGMVYDRSGRNEGPLVADLWDPATKAFLPAQVTGEDMPGIDLLGGRRLWTVGLNAVIWDPTTQTIAQVASLPPSATKTMLPDGRVLVAGGIGGVDVGRQQDLTQGCGPLATLWDPVTDTREATAPLGVSRGHNAAALLQDGRVLVAGNFWTCDQPWSAEIFELR